MKTSTPICRRPGRPPLTQLSTLRAPSRSRGRGATAATNPRLQVDEYCSGRVSTCAHFTQSAVGRNPSQQKPHDTISKAHESTSLRIADSAELSIKYATLFSYAASPAVCCGISNLHRAWPHSRATGGATIATVQFETPLSQQCVANRDLCTNNCIAWYMHGNGLSCVGFVSPSDTARTDPPKTIHPTIWRPTDDRALEGSSAATIEIF